MLQEVSQNHYLSTCDIIAGPASPTLTFCADTLPEDSCDRFVAEDCFYSGESVFNLTNVVSATECQGLLKDFGDIYKADVFVYDGTPTYLCELQVTNKRTCIALAGPDTPDYDICKTKF